MQTRAKQVIRYLLLTLCVVAVPAGGARADMPSETQLRRAIKALDVLAGATVSKFERKDGALQATVTKNGKTATLVGFRAGPNASPRLVPVVTLVIPKMNVGDFLGTAMDVAFKDLALTDVTILLKSRKDRRATVPLSTLPKILRDSIGTMASDVSLDFGIEIFGRMTGKPKGAVPEALKVIGLTRFDDISMRAAMKQSNIRLTLKKTSKWDNPFKLSDVNRQKTSLTGLTLEVTATKSARSVSGWGEVTLNRKKYVLYSQHVFTSGKPGQAYGIDARKITLQSVADFAAAMPWYGTLAPKGLDRLPLDKIVLENPNFRAFDPASNAPPKFETMMLVAASPKTKLPGPGKRTGPLLFANGAATVFGEKIGRIEALLSPRGLLADATLRAPAIGPIKFRSGLAFHIGPKDGRTGLEHEMKFTGRTSLHGLADLSLSVYADIEKLAYHIPAACPLNPVEVKASVPMTAGLVLNGVNAIKDFNVSLGFRDCYSEAILGVIKDPAKLVGITAGLAAGAATAGADAAKEVGAKLVNADKTLKGAWKSSINAGQTAAAAAKSLGKTAAKLGTQVANVGKEIAKLSSSIKSIGKKIARAITNLGGLKKKRKREKRARSKKRSEKARLEAKRARVSRARDKARKAAGRLSPHFDANVVEARTTRASLRFEKKLADERVRYAAILKKDLENPTQRAKLMKLVNVAAIIEEQLPKKAAVGDLLAETDPKAQAGKLGTGVSVVALRNRFDKKRELIAEQIVAAVFDKAMENHLAGVKADPEPEIPFNTPIRIVGEYNLCLEAYRTLKQKFSFRRGVTYKANDYLPSKIRVRHCHDKTQIQDGQAFSTQRFKVTPGGKLQALFDDKDVCFHASGARVSTIQCLNSVDQIFFIDPTIKAIRPMVAKKGQEPLCLQRRYAARPGAQVQLSKCAYAKDGNSVKPHHTWELVKWGGALPKKITPPMLHGLWTNYKKGYSNATVRAANGMVTMSGLIKLRAADQGGALDYGEPIDVLPPEMRPDRRLVFNANSHEAPTRIDIYPNGRVEWKAGNKRHGWVSLDNITYSVKTGTVLSLKSRCTKSSNPKWRAPSYSKSGNTVMLGGLSYCSYAGETHIATLPAGHRPAKTLVFTANAHTQAARINIHTNGKVIWIAGGGQYHGWVSLDGIAFNLPGVQKTAVKLIGGCKAFNVGFAAPTVSSDNGTIRVSGLLTCPFRNGHEHNLGILPSNMRPAKQLVFDLFAGNRSVRIDVLPNGNIRLVSGRDWRVTQKIAGLGKIKTYGASWLSLDGISFAASGTKPIAFKW